jgi:hypothetical protein
MMATSIGRHHGKCTPRTRFTVGFSNVRDTK